MLCQGNSKNPAKKAHINKIGHYESKPYKFLKRSNFTTQLNFTDCI